MSQETFIMAIDQGTTSSRAIIFLKKGEQAALVKRNSLRFSAGWLGERTMPMKFGTRCSR